MQRAASNDGHVIAREFVLVQQLSQLQLNQFGQFLVIHHVHFVQEHQDGGDLDLPREQHVLEGLGHWPIRCADHEDGAVHLRGAGDHVLDVVAMTRRIDVRIMPGIGFVLDVLDRDRDAALALLGRVVDVVERHELGHAFERQHLSDGCRQRRLAMVHVADGADVDVRLGSLEFLSCHSDRAPARRPNTLAVSA